MKKMASISNQAGGDAMSLPGQIFSFLYACVTFVVHNLGPSASDDVLQKRIMTCEACTLMGLEGQRLFRKNDEGTLFCGRPLMEKKIRDPQREGCGCFLEIKWKKAWTSCPNKLW